MKRQNLLFSVYRWSSRWVLCRGICIPGRNIPPQLPECTTVVNNTQLIVERRARQRPQLTLQMQMNTPAASRVCHNKCLTVYGSWKRAPRSKSTPFCRTDVVSLFVYSPWEDQELGSQIPPGKEWKNLKPSFKMQLG